MKSLKQRRRQRLVLANNCEVELCHKWTDWGDKFDRVAAPLASELGEVLPTIVDDCRIVTQHGLMGNRWFVTLENMTTREEVYRAEEKTEADVRAQTWLHLRKASLI